jgi:GNAT superfamily N-acetyltransferase
VEIRRLEPDDWRAFRELRLAALAESPDAFGSTLERERDATESQWLGWITGEGWGGDVATFAADDVGSVIGSATGFHAGDDPRVAHLFGMWVRPDRRKHGVGRDLVAAVVRWASGHPDVEQVVLRVTDSNHDAVRFYSSCGFADTADAPQPLREGSPLMTRTMRMPLGIGSSETA